MEPLHSLGVRRRIFRMRQGVVFREDLCDTAEAARDHLADRQPRFEGWLLVEQHAAQAGRAHDLAAVGSDAAVDQLHQRRLAGAVTADQADPLALLQDKLRLV